MDGLSCCTTDELMLVPPGICPAPCSVDLHYPQLLGHAEDDVLLAAGQFGDVVGAAVAQTLDDLLHQYVGRGCAGGDAYGADTLQPLRTNLVGAVDQVGGCAHAVGQFAQAVGVGAVGTANDQYQIAFDGQLLDCVLAVLGGVSDVVFSRLFYGRIVISQRVDVFFGVAYGQGVLRDKL